MCQMKQFGPSHPPGHISVRSPPASFLPKHPPFSLLAYQLHQANPIWSVPDCLSSSNPSLLLHTPFSDMSCTTSHRPHLHRSAQHSLHFPPPFPACPAGRRCLIPVRPARSSVAAVAAPRRGRRRAAQGPAASRTPSRIPGMDRAVAADSSGLWRPLHAAWALFGRTDWREVLGTHGWKFMLLSLCQPRNRQPLSTAGSERTDESPWGGCLNWTLTSCTHVVVSPPIRLFKYRGKVLQKKSRFSSVFPWHLPTMRRPSPPSFPFIPHPCECRPETELRPCAFRQCRFCGTAWCTVLCKNSQCFTESGSFRGAEALLIRGTSPSAFRNVVFLLSS